MLLGVSDALGSEVLPIYPHLPSGPGLMALGGRSLLLCSRPEFC